MKTNPEAVILGALFDFAGHLRTELYHDPFKAVDSFARLRKLTADEVPTLTWRNQLDHLRDNAERLPSDSDLVTDLLLLAEAFKDGDPDADNKVFDVLSNAVTRLRRPDVQPMVDQACSERWAFANAVQFNLAFRDALDPFMDWADEFEPVDADDLNRFTDKGIRIATEQGLWPLKDGAQ